MGAPADADFDTRSRTGSRARLQALRPRPRFDVGMATLGIGALLASLAGAVLLEAYGVDIAFSDLFYDGVRDRWLIDFDADRGWRIALYQLPKYLVAALSVGLIAALFLDDRQRRGIPSRAFAAALSFWLFSLAVSALKDRTDVYFPRQVERYQPAASMPPPGQWQAADKPRLRIPYRRLWERFEPARPDGIQRGRGFPGAHATAGFYLMGLALLARTRRMRWFWLIAGSIAGWLLGLYQTVNGNHFLSHTLVSWGIAGFFLSAIWMIWGATAPDDATRRAGG